VKVLAKTKIQKERLQKTNKKDSKTEMAILWNKFIEKKRLKEKKEDSNQ